MRQSSVVVLLFVSFRVQVCIKMSSSTSGGDESGDWKAVQSKKERKNNKQKGKKDYKTPSPPRVSKSGRIIKNASNDEMALCTVQECFNEAAGSNSKCVACDRYYNFF